MSTLRRALVAGRLWTSRTRAFFTEAAFPDLPPRDVVRTAYRVLLRRDPDASALEHYTDALTFGHLTPDDVVDRIRASEELRCATPLGARSLLSSLHLSRCEFIVGLPPARRIVDLGGTHCHDGRGALVVMGYPYDFDDLVVVDLPPDDRHDLYKSQAWSEVDTGQSIEHVTPDDARAVVSEVFRVLRPGGSFALDTPNGDVCRIHSPHFIDPDHKVEYSLDEIRAVLEASGFAIHEAKGLNLARSSVTSRTFDEAEVAANYGIFPDARSTRSGS